MIVAYEHEKSNTNTVSVIWKHDAGVARLDELKEVYAKAKAFDEILKLEKETSLYSIVGKEDVELGTEARKIINKYMEDK